MNFLSPKFWYTGNSIRSILLYPLSKIYHFLFILIRAIKNEKKISIPVICVGNIVLGGSGKTPIVMYLRGILFHKFKKIFVLMRAFNSSQKKGCILRAIHTVEDVGDEPLLHFKQGPVCVSKNRIEGADLCIQNNADLIILDDGFQSKHLYKDLNFLVIDGNQKFGNKKIFPAGPLRESINSAFKRTNAIILIDFENKNDDFFKNNKIPYFYAYKKLKLDKLRSNKIIAFCGLGYPDNFFKHLRELNLILHKKFIFGDHHIYKKKEIEEMISMSKKLKIDLVTTEKDIIKIPKKYHKDIKVAKVSIKMESESKFLNFTLKHLNQ